MADLSKASEELAECHAALAALRAASGRPEMRKCWAHFLTHLERTWKKVLAAQSPDSKLKGWSGIREIGRLRNDDPLLSYLVAARGSVEHSIRDVGTVIPSENRVLMFGGVAVMAAG